MQWLSALLRLNMLIVWILLHFVKNVRTSVPCSPSRGHYISVFMLVYFLPPLCVSGIITAESTLSWFSKNRSDEVASTQSSRDFLDVIPSTHLRIINNLDSHPQTIQRTARSTIKSQRNNQSPPRILPDLPNLVRFFDRTGLQIRCRAAGSPPPLVRWFSLPAVAGNLGRQGPVLDSAMARTSNRSLNLQNGLSEFAKDLSQADDSAPVEVTMTSLTTTTTPNSLRPGEVDADRGKPGANQIVVGDGWLNFTATHSSTMRMVFFCQAENYLGRARSRKMVVHQVPMPDESLRIVYTTFPVEPGQKAVITCQPEQGIFNRFLKVNYWEVYLNNTLMSKVDRSFGRFSLINITKHPELHIRSVTESELDGLEARCVLQSIVDEQVKVERPERGRLQRLQFGFSYTELRSVGAEVDVLRGSTVELPWAVEGELSVAVDWFYLNDTSRIRHAIALDSATASHVTEAAPQSHSRRFLPWGTEYELVDGNLRLLNLSVADSGHYIAESAGAARPLRIKYVVRVHAPLGVKVIPNQRTVDWGSQVELNCEISGHPRQLIYWLHNGHLIPRRHRVRVVQPATDTSRRMASSISERLIIAAFSLEDVGVYQCVAENGQLVDRLVAEGNIPSSTEQTEQDLGNLLITNNRPNGAMGKLSSETIGDWVDNAQATAVLTMGDMKPSLTWQHPSPETGSSAAQVLLSVHSGSTEAMLECRFAANPTPHIVWYRDDEKVPLDSSGVIWPAIRKDNATAYTTITTLAVDIRKVPNLDELWTFGGEYRAVAENAHGQADCRIFLLLETQLRLRPMKNDKPAIAGRAYTLKCYFIGSGIPTLQWHRIKAGRDVQRIPVDHRHQLLEGGRVLRITEVSQEEDEADYRCTATHGDRTTNATVTLKVSHAPRLFDLPQTRQVKDTRDMLSYSCALQNRADKPWFAWWEFQREGTNTIIRLPPFKRDTYNGFSVSYVEDLTSLSEDSTWLPPNSLLEKVPSFVHSQPNSAVHVTVDNLRKEEHHGNLTCVVVNEVGEDRRSIRVTFIPELEFAIRPPNNQNVTLGQTIAIDCAAKPSDLDPVVEWKYLQKTTGKFLNVSDLSEATSGRIAQLANGSLLLSNVDESDPREFLCFLRPGRLSTAAQRSSAVNLEVHVPARIERLDDVEKVRGSRFNLTCSVYGDPDDLKVNWYYRQSTQLPWQVIDKPCVVPLALLEEVIPFRDYGSLPTSSTTSPRLVDCQSYGVEGMESGVLFRQISVFKPNKKGLDKQLQFISVKEAHMGEYRCRASNRYNMDRSGTRTEVTESVRLTVISVPGPVNIIYNSNQSTATTVSFSWLPPTQNGNKPIRKYRVRYFQLEPPIFGGSNKASKPNMTELEVTAHHIELQNLRPYTTYRITVVAINDVGPSEESVLSVTTQEAKPEGPVRNLVANGTASDTIVVSWNNPAPELLNGNVDRYLVCRQRINDSFSNDELALLQWPDEQMDPITNSDSTMRGRLGPIHCTKLIRQRDYELNGLPKFTAYAFRVIALNSKGASPPAFTQARTLEDLPQAPPADVSCASQQHSITVSWNPPDPDTINGILTEYHVSYFAENVYGDETSSVNQAVQGQTTVTLAGLLAYTNYTIQVAVSNRKGRGPASPRLSCLTKEAPPTAPEFVKAQPLNATCVVISWSHPKKPQGLTRFYCLEAVPLANSLVGTSSSFLSSVLHSVRAVCVKPNFARDYNYHPYCGLVEEQPYNISVQATNQFKGHKAWSGSVRPFANPPSGIISLGGKILAQNKMPVTMDCLVVGLSQPRWSFPNEHLDDVEILENGTLLIRSVDMTHSGKYECSGVSDSITYDLIVQEISEEPPRKPIWRKFTPSLRGIQAEWLSPGSKRLDSPILWFYLNWTNLYTGARETVRLPPEQRTYYLSNLTCATTVRFQLRASNKVGNSSLTDVSSWTTLGSAPQAANAAQMVPKNYRQQTSVSFNLSAFLPGNGCPPLYYRLIVAPSEDGHFGLGQSLINRTLTRADLITLDGLNRDRCCYNLTNLSSGAHYHYKVIATNAAGSAIVQGQFSTLTAHGRDPVVRQSHLLGQASLFQQPTVIVPITILFAVILVVLVALPFICRHRRLEENLHPNKTVTTECHNDLRTDELSNGKRRGPNFAKSTVPALVDSQSNTMVVPSRVNHIRGHNSSMSRWFSGARTRLYDRGRPGMPEQTAINPQIPIEEDRLSTNSIDSEGNINPYATYAATAALSELMSSGTIGADGSGTALLRSGGPNRADIPYGRGISVPGKRNPQLLRNHSQGPPSSHLYHYPNLMDTSFRAPKLMRSGSMSRFHPTHAFIDPRLMTPSSAALIDPLLTPYDNSTLSGTRGGELEDELNRVSLLQPMHCGLQRRVNSFDSLNCLPNGVVYPADYPFNRANGGGGRSVLPNAPLGPHGTLLPRSGIPLDASFYNSRKPTDPAYHGSVLSSTTASSNQEELMQAYEYSRTHHPKSRLFGFPSTDRTTTIVPRIDPDAVAESGSSDATDSGIRQFTQQPPKPDEARHAACEVPLLYDDGNKRIPMRSGAGPSGKFGPVRTTAIHPSSVQRLHPAAFTRSESLTSANDTYASVEYSVHGRPTNNVFPGRMDQYGQQPIRQAVSTRIGQPLPALPSAYNNDGPSCYDAALSKRLYPCPPGAKAPLLSRTHSGPKPPGTYRDNTINGQSNLPRLTTNPDAPSRLDPSISSTVPGQDPSEENVYTSEFVLV